MVKHCCNKEDEDLMLLADFLRVISEENRLKIICFLQKCDEKCVCEIQDFLGLSQNLVSHHLKVLRDFGVIKNRKQGLNVHYSINTEEFGKYNSILKRILRTEGSR